jgi:hypothetical protein
MLACIPVPACRDKQMAGVWTGINTPFLVPTSRMVVDYSGVGLPGSFISCSLWSCRSLPGLAVPCVTYASPAVMLVKHLHLSWLWICLTL